jgi:putative lipase involved disintegration of autophagic bodies
MTVILGSGEHRYRVVEDWAKLPEHWNLTDVASVAVDSKDRIHVFNRGAHPMVVLDREGNFIARTDCTSTLTTTCTAPMTAITRCANARRTARCC